MHRWILCLLLFTLTADAARCTGNAACKSCKNCKFCRHCSKKRQTSCGVCKPPFLVGGPVCGGGG